MSLQPALLSAVLVSPQGVFRRWTGNNPAASRSRPLTSGQPPWQVYVNVVKVGPATSRPAAQRQARGRTAEAAAVEAPSTSKRVAEEGSEAMVATTPGGFVEAAAPCRPGPRRLLMEKPQKAPSLLTSRMLADLASGSGAQGRGPR
jgi:hypothetical protein